MKFDFLSFGIGVGFTLMWIFAWALLAAASRGDRMAEKIQEPPWVFESSDIPNPDFDELSLKRAQKK